MALNERFVMLAEKPDAAKMMAKPFPHEIKNGYIEVKPNPLAKKGGIITYAFGHLVRIPNPEFLDEKYKKWSLDTLPILPTSMPLVPIKGKERQLQIIKTLVNNSDIKLLINACDAGREGEAIFTLIYKYLGFSKPVKRLWTSSLMVDAITMAFGTLKDSKETEPLFYSAYARMIADYYVGISTTRLVSLLLQKAGVTNQGVFSLGRVQSVLVRLIYDREREIENFKSFPYWNLQATFQIRDTQYVGKWINKEGLDKLQTADRAKIIKEKIDNRKGYVEQVEKERKTIKPPLLFNLSALQIKANKLFKYSPKETLDICQKLYDNSVISYPRTDSQYITESEVKELPVILKKISVLQEYKNLFPTFFTSDSLGRNVVNSRRVSDHHAILPTRNVVGLNQLTEKERNIYDLIIRSLIAVHYDNEVVNYTKFITKVEGELFISRGKEIEEEGWKKVFSALKDEPNSHEKDELILPLINQGEITSITQTEIKEGKSQPPKRYTQGQLISLMKSAGRVLDDKDLTRILNKTEGLGTEATRASIIENILEKRYIVIKRNIVHPTSKAMLLMKALGEDLIITSPEVTAKWEKALEAISHRKYNYKDFIENAKKLTIKLCNDIKDLSTKWDFEDEIAEINKKESLGPCPVCGADIVEYEKVYGCLGYKEKGCIFKVFKTIAQKKITPAQIRKLLKSKKTDVIKGFKSEDGKKFDDYIYWDEEENKVKLGYNRKEKPKVINLSCPCCKKVLKEHEKFISCSGYKNGCQFLIQKVICGNEINSELINQLLTQGHTEIIEGFIYNERTFNAALCIIDGKVKFKK